MRILDRFKSAGKYTEIFQVEVSSRDIAHFESRGKVPEVEVGKFIHQYLKRQGNRSDPKKKWRRKANRRWRALAG